MNRKKTETGPDRTAVRFFFQLRFIKISGATGCGCLKWNYFKNRWKPVATGFWHLVWYIFSCHFTLVLNCIPLKSCNEKTKNSDQTNQILYKFIFKLQIIIRLHLTCLLEPPKARLSNLLLLQRNYLPATLQLNQRTSESGRLQVQSQMTVMTAV